MTQLRSLQTNALGSRLLFAGILGVSLLFTVSALAEYIPPSQPSSPQRGGSPGTIRNVGNLQYVPPSQPSRPSRTVTNGTRGSCGKATGGNLTTLAPISHTGQTIATHPTFAWYVPDQDPSWVEFTLYESNGKGGYTLLYKKQLESTKERLRTFTLPTDVAGLSDRQTYLWQVELLCDPSNPSKNTLAVATIDVVATPPTLKAALAQTPDHLQRAQLYAQAGIWYDALAESLDGSVRTKPVWLDLVASLSRLETVTSLSGLETPSAVAAHKQGEQLQTIVSLEQSGTRGTGAR